MPHKATPLTGPLWLSGNSVTDTANRRTRNSYRSTDTCHPCIQSFMPGRDFILAFPGSSGSCSTSVDLPGWLSSWLAVRQVDRQPLLARERHSCCLRRSSGHGGLRIPCAYYSTVLEYRTTNDQIGGLAFVSPFTKPSAETSTGSRRGP